VGKSGTNRATILRNQSRAGWTTVDHNASGTIFAVWGTSGDDEYTVGSFGDILHWDGTRWFPMGKITPYRLYDVTGYRDAGGAWHVFAAGLAGVVIELDRDSMEWRQLPAGTSEDLIALAVGRGDALYAAGANGTVMRWTDHWESVDLGTRQTFYGMHALAGGELLLVGGDEPGSGIMFHLGPE